MVSLSGRGQAFGSSTPAPLDTSTIPSAKPPDPLNLEDRSRRGDNWLLFKRTWQIYEQATRISKQEGPVHVAHFLNVIERDGVQMFDTFTFREARQFGSRTSELYTNLDVYLSAMKPTNDIFQ